MTDRDSSRILKKLQDHWDQIQAGLQRLNQIAEVRPSERQVIRSVDTTSTESATFELIPVVFNFPERASSPQNDLYVVVTGRISFRRADFLADQTLKTDCFRTRVAYFRRRAGALVHVFGAHYDFSVSETGHPAFHGQMGSFVELAGQIKEQFGIDGEVEDSVRDILRTVRVPTAQMDVFSLILQLCADHLLHKGSAAEEVSAFRELMARNGFCQGAAFQFSRFASEEARTCYRARHWYPVPV